mmetsp:Transcript_62026/g.147818  ORF Transcript_62026/g.147818 Transcript_62026/m.147818 type:complete len:224 (+) Transcript_62026:360-1031(+)
MDEEADFVEVFRAVRVDALRGPEYRVRPPPLVAEVERLRNHVERRSFELGEILGRDFCGERREHRRHHELPRHLGALVDDKRADNGFDAVCRQPQEPPLVGREALEAAFRSHPPVRVHSLMHLEVRHSADDERSDSPLRDSDEAEEEVILEHGSSLREQLHLSLARPESSHQSQSERALDNRVSQKLEMSVARMQHRREGEEVPRVPRFVAPELVYSAELSQG